MALSLAGKTAIITGAGSGNPLPSSNVYQHRLLVRAFSGINLAFTRYLLARQCNVLLADLSLRPEAQDLVNAHSSRTRLSNGQAVFHKTDLRVWKDLEKMFEAARNVFGGDVDVVCPGAGVYEPVSSRIHCSRPKAAGRMVRVEYTG